MPVPCSDPIFVSKKDEIANDSISVELSTEVEGLDIYYSFDNSNPDNFYREVYESLIHPLKMRPC